MKTKYLIQYFLNLLTADTRKSQQLPALALTNKLNAELQESFSMKEMDNTDGISASKMYKVNNSGPESHITGMVRFDKISFFVQNTD